jgi:hypothetical protein
MDNLKTVKRLFSKELSKALLKNYRKEVSIVFFVNQFNLRAHGTNVIAYETGRKWLKGLALPMSLRNCIKLKPFYKICRLCMTC